MARPLVSDYAANPASSSGAWKSGEKSCFPGGNLGRDSASYVKPFVFNVLRGGLRSETGLRSRAVPSTNFVKDLYSKVSVGPSLLRSERKVKSIRSFCADK